MEFGVPSKRRAAATEKHIDTPVITLMPFEGENTSRKMEFNKKAYEVMGLKKDDTNNVAFSFNKSNFNDNSIVNTNGVELDASLNLAKNGKISNKSHYEEIKGRYGASLEEELELTLVDSGVEFQGQKVFKLVSLAASQELEKAKAANADLPDYGAEHAAKVDQIKNHGGQGVPPVSVGEDPSDEKKAELLEEDYAEQLKSPGTPAAVTANDDTPWGKSDDNDYDELVD